MNLYHCLIELRSDARALAFSQACAQWMEHLQAQGLITGWRLLRRKFGLASGPHTDYRGWPRWRPPFRPWPCRMTWQPADTTRCTA
jgi:hypothetical protein